MEWIKCSDRMPDVYDYVLVCANFQGTDEPKPIHLARQNIEWDEGWTKVWEFLSGETGDVMGAWMDNSYDMNAKEITHWMPLPKPPENDA